MRSKKTTIIILGNKNYKESDKLLFTYSKEFGKILLTAKGARKLKSKFIGQIQTLNIAKAEVYFGPHSTILTDIKTLYTPKKIQSNISSMISALQIAELTNQCIPDRQEIAGLYALLKETLINLEKNKKSELVLISYTVKFLNLMGLMPNFKEIQTQLPEKYLRFFEYVKSSSFPNLMKIALKKQDENIIRDITKKILELQNQKASNTLKFNIAF